jgi:methionine synthase II (cobalamin-independent)
LATNTRSPYSPARSDDLGSLLRPRDLLAEVHRVYEWGPTALRQAERETDRTRLSKLEDAAIRTAVQRQVDAGLDVLIDGEFRRVLFTNSFYDAVEGVERNSGTLTFHGEDAREVTHPRPPLVSGRMCRIDSPGAREAAFLAGLPARASKVTFPAPSWFCFQSYRASAVQNGIYESVAELLNDTVDILGELASDAARAGASCVQFEEPAHVFLATPYVDEFLKTLGNSARTLEDLSVENDRRCLAGLPEGITTAVHLCRGSYASWYTESGALDPMAAAILSLPFDRFLIEWEDAEREGDFSALRFVPSPGPIVVLGIVSSRDRRIGSEDELLPRVDEATRQVDGRAAVDFAAARIRVGGTRARRSRRQRARRRRPVAQARGAESGSRPHLDLRRGE